MTTTTLTEVRPVEGPEYDKDRPETRLDWIEFRVGGITATEIRDWGSGAKRRDIIASKVTGEVTDLSEVPAIAHGNTREPMIAAWVEGRFGITGTNRAYSHGENPRHMASPDGITRDPFSGELVVGAGSALCEIKTSKHDLTPGPVTSQNVLIRVEPGSYFEKTGYYVQMQWQMYVMNAERTLFVWEQHTGVINTATGTYDPIGTPLCVWIERDDELIAKLVNEVAVSALAEIDAARIGLAADLPPVTELGATEAMLIADLLAARDAEAVASKAKAKAWAALQEFYLGKPDLVIEADGFARISTTTSTTYKKVTDVETMRAEAPEVVEQYEALLAQYTTETPQTVQRLTINPVK